MSFNLIRNARMFFTSNVNVNTGQVNTTGFTTSNTKEIQVLDGLSFSQATGSETVTISEAGDTPVRGQRSFNTSLEPVELTFSTYIRPFFTEGNNSNVGYEADDVIDAEEDVLWNAFAAGYVDGSAELIGGASAAWTKTAGVVGPPAVEPYSTLSFANSSKNQMQKFGVIIVIDSTSYVIDNCVLDQATIDFGLDAIATIAWTARGSTLRSATITATQANPVVFGGAFFSGGTNQAKAKITTAPFLANKLSKVEITSNISGTGGTSYTLALTGGSITLANNVTYLTPANLGTVNKPFTYFTGTRAISGSINCYLRTGNTNSAGLLAQMLTDSATDVEPDFQVKLSIGGPDTANTTRVVLTMPACVFTIPAINTEQVVSSTINFTAQGYNGTAFAIDQANEATVKYYSANTTTA